MTVDKYLVIILSLAVVFNVIITILNMVAMKSLITFMEETLKANKAVSDSNFDVSKSLLDFAQKFLKIMKYEPVETTEYSEPITEEVVVEIGKKTKKKSVKKEDDLSDIGLTE